MQESLWFRGESIKEEYEAQNHMYRFSVEAHSAHSLSWSSFTRISCISYGFCSDCFPNLATFPMYYRKKYIFTNFSFLWVHWICSWRRLKDPVSVMNPFLSFFFFFLLLSSGWFLWHLFWLLLCCVVFFVCLFSFLHTHTKPKLPPPPTKQKSISVYIEVVICYFSAKYFYILKSK